MITFISYSFFGLSLLAPLLFIRLVIRLQPEDENQKNKRNALLFTTVLWSAFVWWSGFTDLFAYSVADTFPRFLIPLFLPVILFLAFWTNGPFRRLMDQIHLTQLVGYQFWRIFGVLFFWVALYEMGPSDLKASGIGDALTGGLAILTYYLLNRGYARARVFAWGFMSVGMLDLLGVLYILLKYYPIGSDQVPSSAGAGAYPMLYIVGIVAPLALVFHCLTLRKLLIQRNQ